jgi:Glyoxalase-like domain
MKLDHLAVSAATLAEGVAMVETALGVSLAAGGQHLTMGTHNRLLGLGDIYLEVIAVDPSLPAPDRPRWFDLDRFVGAPRLTNWVAACDDLSAELAISPPGTGVAMALSRGDLDWQMAIPDDGCLPFDGASPALIAWQGALHPARVLPECGVRLLQLDVTHPQAAALQAALAGRMNDPRVVITQGPAKAMRAVFSTPQGQRVLE